MFTTIYLNLWLYIGLPLLLGWGWSIHCATELTSKQPKLSPPVLLTKQKDNLTRRLHTSQEKNAQLHVQNRQLIRQLTNQGAYR